MGLKWPNAGANDVGSFLISGIPFVVNGTSAGSATKVAFPTVTRTISVKNTDSSGILAVGFTENGVNDNPSGINRRFLLAAGEERTLDVRIKDLWVLGETGTPTFDVVAGLTHVPRSGLPTITGSVVTDVPGEPDGVPPIFKGVG